MSDDVRADIVQTHISAVLFWGDRAYKIKKPVKTAFLDFSTRLKRLEACHREVELNRRMAPDVYLGVADVVGPNGDPCDHMVVMRRMPDERRLAHLIASGSDVSEEIKRIAKAVVVFHSRAEKSATISAGATREALEDRWRSNLSEFEPFLGDVLNYNAHEVISTLSFGYLGGREPLLDERIADGFIRDCHGDLLADDIFCLEDGPRILDCIEFDDSFRYIDVIDDAATLAMDIHRLGAPEAAHDFMAFYREFSAENHPPTLEAHYVAYRALVRAKVACLRYEQGHSPSKRQARLLFDLCAKRLRDAEVRLVLIGGLPGTGKSTLARALGDKTSWPVLRSDEIRNEIVPSGRPTDDENGYGQGAYRQAFTDKTYAILLERARNLLQGGYPVIVDATWGRVDLRRQAEELAASADARLIEIECSLDPAIAADRMRVRARTGEDASEATPEIAARMASEFAPWPSALQFCTEAPVIRLLPKVEDRLALVIK